MSGIEITYLWPSKEFPPSIRLEGKRGDYEVYTPERTCKQVLTNCDDGLMPPFTAHCSACGDEWGFTPNYCPNCGAKVVRS